MRFKRFRFALYVILGFRCLMFESIWPMVTLLFLVSVVEGAHRYYPERSWPIVGFTIIGSFFLVLLPMAHQKLNEFSPVVARAFKDRAVWVEFWTRDQVAPDAPAEVYE